ncbi:MAG: hypothetical protein C0478_17615 [Planctomyces sp.]|nr:hypothetical protein [Planctomyces sp.]
MYLGFVGQVVLVFQKSGSGWSKTDCTMAMTVTSSLAIRILLFFTTVAAILGDSLQRAIWVLKGL